MRTLLTSACLTTAAATVLLAAPAAYANGDNGTVKIHDAETGEALMKNEPHVCTFYLDAFKFDAGQEATWRIVEWAPTGTKDKVVLKGEATLDAAGHKRTEDLQLEDGHYRLYWNFVGENGKAKHKNFWVACEDEQSGDDGDTPGTTPSEGASTTPGDEASQPASTDPSSPSDAESSAAAAPSSAPSPDAGSEDLAETGSSAPVGAIAGAAALLLGAGAYLTLRRRNSRAQQH